MFLQTCSFVIIYITQKKKFPDPYKITRVFLSFLKFPFYPPSPSCLSPLSLFCPSIQTPAAGKLLVLGDPVAGYGIETKREQEKPFPCRICLLLSTRSCIEMTAERHFRHPLHIPPFHVRCHVSTLLQKTVANFCILCAPVASSSAFPANKKTRTDNVKTTLRFLLLNFLAKGRHVKTLLSSKMGQSRRVAPICRYSKGKKKINAGTPVVNSGEMRTIR